MSSTSKGTKPSLKEKFTGFAKKAFEKLKHPVDSIKEAIKHEQDRIIYWSKVADDAYARKMYIGYYTGITGVCGSTLLASFIGVAAPYLAVLSASVPVYIGVSHYFKDLAANKIMQKRAERQSSYTGSADNNTFNDDAKEWVVEDHLRSSAQFGYIMDSAFKFGKIRKTLKQAEKIGKDGFHYTGRTLTSTDRGDVSVAIRNIQKHAALSIKDMDGAAGLAETISDPAKKAAAYMNITDYATMLSKKSTLIPDADNPSQSIGDTFLLKAAEYRQKADHITHNVDPMYGGQLRRYPEWQ